MVCFSEKMYINEELWKNKYEISDFYLHFRGKI